MNINDYNILSYRPIKISEIPTIDLYMDQVLVFLYERIKGFKSDENDKIMTKTMINNYVKSKLIDLPIKKKYNIEHIKNLIMIYHFKNVLSIKEINKLFQISKEDNPQINLYNLFYNIQMEELSLLQNVSVEKEEVVEIDKSDENIEFIVKNIVKADIHSRIAQKQLNKIIFEL